jgi:hypothetical protein
MRASIFFATLVAASTWLTAFAHAQVSPQSHTCTGKPDVDWDRQIASCSALIQSDQETPAIRAAAYYNRGTAWRTKGDVDRAIANAPLKA